MPLRDVDPDRNVVLLFGVDPGVKDSKICVVPVGVRNPWLRAGDSSAESNMLAPFGSIAEASSSIVVGEDDPGSTCTIGVFGNISISRLLRIWECLPSMVRCASGIGASSSQVFW